MPENWSIWLQFICFNTYNYILKCGLTAKSGEKGVLSMGKCLDCALLRMCIVGYLTGLKS